jgi:hypothetical protein
VAEENFQSTGEGKSRGNSWYKEFLLELRYGTSKKYLRDKRKEDGSRDNEQFGGRR